MKIMLNPLYNCIGLSEIYNNNNINIFCIYVITVAWL